MLHKSINTYRETAELNLTAHGKAPVCGHTHTRLIIYHNHNIW